MKASLQMALFKKCISHKEKEHRKIIINTKDDENKYNILKYNMIYSLHLHKINTKNILILIFPSAVYIVQLY